ncbi:hypothetical protein [Sphaerisporangium aureirubrum]|uniref:Uncharacterized protein n=1 Tax=Sphaerisporangium aureirubrum TaxID=1544736 RepID=A0ABW1NUZ3_9ACTN
MLVAAVLAAVQVLVADRFGINVWTMEWGSYSDSIDWDHAVTRSTWYPVASTLVASVITYRVCRRAPWSWLWLPPAAWLGSCLTAVPLLYGLASAVPDDGRINSSPSVVVGSAILGGAIGGAAAMVALRHREVGVGLVVYTLWVSFLEFTRPWWWERAPAFDPMLTERVLTGTGEYVVKAKIIEAGGVTAGLIGPVIVSGIVAAWAAVQRGRWRSGVVAGVAGPLLLCSVYLTIDSGMGDQDSMQLTLWYYSILAVLIGLCVSAVTATVAQITAKWVQGGSYRLRHSKSGL